MSSYQTRKLTVIAQDPGVRGPDDRILRAEVEIPNEELAPGPRGYRVQVIDYDASTRTLYKPYVANDQTADAPARDPFAKASDKELLSNPGFHAQNVYAIVMRTLARFEFALGRRVGWSFGGHQLQVAPHAFADANAFYSKRDRALMFGYFPNLAKTGTVLSCLSHDVIAHETTHALLDGLRARYTDPSSSDQAAFHEGFADIVALLSVFSLRNVVALTLDLGSPRNNTATIERKYLTPEMLRQSIVLGLAEQMGQEMSGIRGNALRRSVALPPSKKYLQSPAFDEPHRRGEVLVAAILNAFVQVWVKRLEALGSFQRGEVDRDRVVEEGAEAADYLLTSAVRALDYSPPCDIVFGDFASALLTADFEVHPADGKYRFREVLRKSFEDYGMSPTSRGTESEPGIWDPPPEELDYSSIHRESLQSDRDEMFRLLWQNRARLRLHEEAYTEVQSVRPCLRIGSDGFFLRETVAEYVQILTLKARELKSIGVERPEGMPDEREVRLYGGSALLFDQAGRLKYVIGTGVLNAERQSQRLAALWKYGHFSKGATGRRRFAAIHRQRMSSWATSLPSEEYSWLSDDLPRSQDEDLSD